MPDNKIANAGSGGATFATDDIAGVDYPRTKITIGADGVNDGDVSASNPMPVNTELPAAAALADNQANPTTSLIGSCLCIFDGTTWDRAPGTTADGLTVNLGINNDVVATISGTVTVATHAVTQSGTWTVQPGNTANTTAWLVTGTGGSFPNTVLDLLHQSDFDSGAGTDTTPAIGIAVAASGGAAVITGDVTNGLDVDVTRVSGTVTISGAVTIDAAAVTSLALIDDGIATVASAITTKGMAAVGTDGTNARILKTDTSGELQVDVLTMPTVTVDSELPAAAALADNTANPTTTSVGTFPHWFDGVTWDRALGNSTDGLLVNLGGNNDVVATVSGTVTVTGVGGTFPVTNAALSVVGGGVEATALRVTIASDSTGVLSVDDNAGSLTVDNAVLDLLHQSDFDSGAGTDTTPSIGIAVAASGGAAVITGDVTNGLDVDVTRVTGTVTVDSELPAAAALADNTANPTTTSVGTFPHWFDGTAWDRAIGNSTDGLTVNLGINNDVVATISGTVTVAAHAVTNAGVFAVQVDGAALTALQLLDDIVATLGTTTYTETTTKGAVVGAVRKDAVGTLAGTTNEIGPLQMEASGALRTAPTAVTTGGATPARLISAATTNATSVTAVAGTLYSLSVTNINAAIRYIKFYNKVSAPTVGTDTPVLVYGIPGNTAGAGHAVPIPACGIEFTTGIAFALTTGIADTDATAVAANELAVAYSYK